MFVLAIILGGLLIYSDWFGNLTMQKDITDLFKVAVGAIIGAWANEVAK